MIGRVERTAVPRPAGAPYTFVCPRCDLVLADGTGYLFCPACDSAVDFVDLNRALWCCPSCDAMVNEDSEFAPRCERCQRTMRDVHGYERPPHLLPPVGSGWWERALNSPPAFGLAGVLMLLPAVAILLDPALRWFVIGTFAVVVALPFALAASWLGNIAAEWRELRDLARDRRTRVLHGLEHATIRELRRRGYDAIAGLTENGYFKVWLRSERRRGEALPRGPGITGEVRRSCERAIQRVRRRGWPAAIDLYCGTSWLALILLASLLVVGTTLVGLFTTVTAGQAARFVGVALAGLLAVGPALGWLLQRTLTIDVHFHRARVVRVLRKIEHNGRSCFYVHVDVTPVDPVSAAGRRSSGSSSRRTPGRPARRTPSSPSGDSPGSGR